MWVGRQAAGAETTGSRQWLCGEKKIEVFCNHTSESERTCKILLHFCAVRGVAVTSGDAIGVGAAFYAEQGTRFMRYW